VITKGKVSFQAGQFMGVYECREQMEIDETSSLFRGTNSIASPPRDLLYISFAVVEDQNKMNSRRPDQA
jgi:hypothetical protein